MAVHPPERPAVVAFRPPAADLDGLFGRLLDPIRVDPLEALHRPSSLMALDERGAARLKLLMESAEHGLGITRYVFSELPILWVIDRDGVVWLAIEEVVEAERGAFVRPRLRGTTADPPLQRLGHPSLLGGGEGRIGGEIIFDLGAGMPCWCITNSSGRYGLRAGRQPVHLANAAKKFRDHGISVVEKFTQPRKGSP